MQTIVALLSGMQLGIVHLANIIGHHHGISAESIAESFDKTAELIPAEVQNREIQQLALRQIADGIRNSAAGPEYEALLSRLLH